MANARVHITMRVEGMTCDGCARHIAKALQGVAGVEHAQVGSWKSGQTVAIANSNVESEVLSRHRLWRTLVIGPA